MIAYIVVEGSTDAALLQAVLPKELLESVELVVAGGISSAKSLTRSLLVRRRTPVALVIDADSTVPELIQERRQSAEEVIKSVAGNVLVEVIVAVPALDAVLFQDPILLEIIFGQPITQDMLALAKTNPRNVLEALIDSVQYISNRHQVIDLLRTQNLKALQNADVVQELIEFLRQAHQGSQLRSTMPTRP